MTESRLPTARRARACTITAIGSVSRHQPGRRARVSLIMAASISFSVILAGVRAQQADSFGLALNLGLLLASEQFCGLSYDQDAIKQFIAEHVAKDDMGFASDLQDATDGETERLKSMSESEKTATCTQVGRVARVYGFIR